MGSSATPPTVAVRASALTGYPDCARRSAARLFWREVKDAGYELRELSNSIGAAVGTAVHSGVAYSLSELAADGKLPPFSAVSDATMDALAARSRDGVFYDRETPTGQVAERQSLEMVRMYQVTVAPHVNPILIEKRLEADTGFGILLTGQPDQVCVEPGRIRDLKTGKMRSSHRPQVGAYSLLARTHGVNIEVANIDFIQRVGANKPQPMPEEIPQDVAGAESAAMAVLRHIAGDLNVWRNGDPARHVRPGDPWAFTANPSSKLCGEKYCPAWGTNFCTEHQVKTEG